MYTSFARDEAGASAEQWVRAAAQGIETFLYRMQEL
jgi:hypothetical protein